jgi:hypothetical protein
MPRQIPCNFCSGQVLSQNNGRAARSASLWPKFQNVVLAITDVLNLLTDNQTTVDRKSAIGGKCEACGGKGYVNDPTDTSDADKAAAESLKSNHDEMVKNLNKLGSSPGGSRFTRVAGAETLVVGHTLNTADSVAVIDNQPGPGGKGVHSAKTSASVDKGTKEHAQVIDLNPPANSGGGQYNIVVGNQFNVMVGAQGMSLYTYGKMNLHAVSKVEITGAEVTVGTSAGQTSIGGKHIAIEADNISLNPTGQNGQVGVHGSIAATGNIQSGGAYHDNLYFANATCPSKQVSVNAGAGGDIITGPAVWGGFNTAASRAAALNLIKFVQSHVLDLDLFKAAGPITPRFYFGMADHMFNLIYSIVPLELKVTGITIGVGIGATVGVVYNFPHTHAVGDTVHTHRVTVPAINYEQHPTADSVRQAFSASGGNTQVPASGGTGVNFFAQLYTTVGNAVNAIGGLFSATSTYPTISEG